MSTKQPWMASTIVFKRQQQFKLTKFKILKLSTGCAAGLCGIVSITHYKKCCDYRTSRSRTTPTSSFLDESLHPRLATCRPGSFLDRGGKSALYGGLFGFELGMICGAKSILLQRQWPDCHLRGRTRQNSLVRNQEKLISPDQA